MIRIGLVDLDTSHPLAFTRILRTMPDIRVGALWDGHDVWPAGYDRQFAAEQNIPVVCTSLEEMPEHVDAAMIHGTNWDLHIDRALVFLKAKIPVLIDKPIVGSVRDCDRILDLQEKYGTPVYGGSSLRYAREVTAMREAIGPPGNLECVVGSGPGDFFSYGIHTTEMVQGLLGPGINWVEPVAGSKRPILAVAFRNRPVAIVQLQMPFHEWSLSAYTDRGLRTTTVSTEHLYEPFLENFIALLRGKTIDYTLAGPVEAVRLHIAARIAMDKQTRVPLDSLPADAGFDGRAFAAEYAAAKGAKPPIATKG